MYRKVHSSRLLQGVTEVSTPNTVGSFSPEWCVNSPVSTALPLASD